MLVRSFLVARSKTEIAGRVGELADYPRQRASQPLRGNDDGREHLKDAPERVFDRAMSLS